MGAGECPSQPSRGPPEELGPSDVNRPGGERTQFRSQGLGNNPRKYWSCVKNEIAGRAYPAVALPIDLEGSCQMHLRAQVGQSLKLPGAPLIGSER